MRYLVLLIALIANSAMAEMIAIVGGKIHVGNGDVINNGTILIDEHAIVEVGVGIEVPEAARIINASGKHVTPGIFSGSTAYGLSEGASRNFGNDNNANDSGITASFDVSYALDSSSAVIREARRQGVTRAVSAPQSSGDIFSGTSALITTENSSDMHFAEGAMHAKFGNAKNRSIAWNRIRAIFNQVLDYDRNRSRAMRGQSQDYLLSIADMDALVPVLNGDKTLVLEMGSEAEIRGAIRLKNEYDLELVIQGGQEAWKVAAELATNEIPVMVVPEQNTFDDVRMGGATFSNAGRLEAAGVTVAIYSSNGALYDGHHLVQFAGMAVAHGMSHEGAIQAITGNPAKIFGVDNVVGTLEEGMDADVVVWDGDPLEVTSNTDHVLIRGVEYELTSRRTLLRDRYLNLDRGEHFGKRYQGQ